MCYDVSAFTSTNTPPVRQQRQQVEDTDGAVAVEVGRAAGVGSSPISLRCGPTLRAGIVLGVAQVVAATLTQCLIVADQASDGVGAGVQ